MKREAKKDPDLILWKKIGGGSFHANIGGVVRIIKPGQQFHAREEEIPTGFRDVVVPVDPVKAAKNLPKEEMEVKAKAEEPKYTLQHRGGGWWDVVNEDGKVQNENALKKDAAEELLESLN